MTVLLLLFVFTCSARLADRSDDFFVFFLLHLVFLPRVFGSVTCIFWICWVFFVSVFGLFMSGVRGRSNSLGCFSLLQVPCWRALRIGGFLWVERDPRLSRLSFLCFAFIFSLFPSYPSCLLTLFIFFCRKRHCSHLALSPHHVLPSIGLPLTPFLFFSFVFYLITPKKKQEPRGMASGQVSPVLSLFASSLWYSSFPHLLSVVFSLH